MYCKDLLLRVFDADVVEGATYDDCVQLLDGAIRLGVDMDEELSNEIVTWLLDSYGPVDWPETPRVGQLVNGYDGDFGLFVYPIPPRMRQDAHVIEISRKETTVSSQFVAAAERRQDAVEQMMTDAIAATKRSIAEMLDKKAAEAPERLEVTSEEAAAGLEVAVIENIWALGTEGLARKTVRQLQAMCRLISVKVGGRKAEIVARLAQLVEFEEVPEAEETVAGDPMKYLVTLAELLPQLAHRTSDGRWYLKGYRISFVLEVDGKMLKWSQKGLVPNKWTKFAGEAMLVPAVIVVPASSAS